MSLWAKGKIGWLAIALAFASCTDSPSPSAEEKAQFQAKLHQAIAQNQPAQLDALLYTEGMEPELVELSRSSQRRLVELLHPEHEHLTFQWQPAPLRGARALTFRGANDEFRPNAKPVAVLQILRPGQTDKAIQINLCQPEKELRFIGTLRKPLPPTPPPP